MNNHKKKKKTDITMVVVAVVVVSLAVLITWVGSDATMLAKMFPLTTIETPRTAYLALGQLMI